MRVYSRFRCISGLSPKQVASVIFRQFLRRENAACIYLRGPGERPWDSEGMPGEADYDSGVRKCLQITAASL